VKQKHAAMIMEEDTTPQFSVIWATAPLTRVLGYASTIAGLGADASAVMWLSHYGLSQASPPLPAGDPAPEDATPPRLPHDVRNNGTSGPGGVGLAVDPSVRTRRAE
jgi:hypothetical protein